MGLIATLRKTMRNYLPVAFLEWRQRRVNARKVHMTMQEVFTTIYNVNEWGSRESRSGGGSTINATEAARQGVERIVRELNAKIVHDIPCGDFNWMQHVDLGDSRYIGSDIVPQLIEQNRVKHFSATREFRVLNLCVDPLPRADLVLVRDCLIHLSFSDIRAAVRNLRASESTYLLASTYIHHPRNYDTPTGGARRLNLCLEPFNFPTPLELIRETTDGDEADPGSDKSLGLWRIAELPSFAD